jgi:hypothetical protein
MTLGNAPNLMSYWKLRLDRKVLAIDRQQRLHSMHSLTPLIDTAP